MISAIIAAIVLSLDAEFGNMYQIYKEDTEQGLEGPCFFVSCVSSWNKQLTGRQCLRESRFAVRYIPEGGKEPNGACYTVADRLFACLVHLTVDGCPAVGTQMQCEMTEGVLNFYVNYDMYTYTVQEAAPSMGDFAEKISLIK